MKNKITIIKSNKFKDKNISYGFFTRNGGVSSNPFNTLNCSSSNGDDKKNVNQNIKLSLKELQLSKNKLILGNQIHSNNVIIINSSNFNKIIKADGLITKNKKFALGILTADCAPIFFYDSKKEVIGAAHAGWKGCMKNICFAMIKKMKKIGCDKNNIKTIIGPCINVKNYEVSNSFYTNFVNNNKKYSDFFINKAPNKIFFNLSKALEYQLSQLKIKNITLKKGDTYSDNSKYFSHRRSTHLNENTTGRMINIIGFL